MKYSLEFGRRTSGRLGLLELKTVGAYSKEDVTDEDVGESGAIAFREEEDEEDDE
ncbi:hypothetical protein Csa_005278 [Cucumis sativus]|uniref:Uncharacterized protein n=1 Tax=Cucumis sativus TaxID=3659 RepID=A0A0A0K825_CUCSA|nr:hypothetical protein Csa_005278 [Cucumis sativus]